MNETPPETETGFDPHKVRGIADVKRASDDRMVAGVCSGIAKYLNIDPVILRVVLAALTLVGFAGVILYLAGWILLPSDNADSDIKAKSLAAQWFKLDENEEQFRIVGLIIAGVLAITAGTGLFGNNWDARFPWFGLIALAAVYFWIIKPAQRRKERNLSTTTSVPDLNADGEPVTAATRTPIYVPKPRKPWSPVLTFVTLSSALIAMGAVALYANANDALPWTTYAVTALGVIAVGLLIGTLYGNGGLLIPIGGAIAIVLAVSAVLPSSRIGHDVYPESSSSVSGSYKLGIGEMDLNLGNVDNQVALTGRTIKVEVGIGSTRIVVPKDLNVEVRATLNAGEIRVFDRKVNGTRNKLDYPADNERASKLTLDVDQTFGDIEVIKQ